MRTTAMVATTAAAIWLGLSGCGKGEPDKSACAIVDMSTGSAAQLKTSYLPGVQKFVERAVGEGDGRVCFGLAGAGASGGSTATVDFRPINTDDVTAEGETQQKVYALASELAAAAAAADQPGGLGGASAILETFPLVAEALKPGDELLMAGDCIQASDLTDFTRASTDLSDPGIEALLADLDRRSLLPDLTGITLRMPWALTGRDGRPLNMSTQRQQRVEAFWRAYAARAGVETLVWRGGLENA